MGLKPAVRMAIRPMVLLMDSEEAATRLHVFLIFPGAKPFIAQDTYCSTTPSALDGTCTGMCLSCQAALGALTGYGNNNNVAPGYYPRGCTDVRGYEWAPCDEAARPPNSIWISSSTIPGAVRGCKWACGATAYPWNGGCLPCISASSVATTCVSGQVAKACNAYGTFMACQPCTGPMPGAFQAWRSEGPDFAACLIDCEEGVAFRASGEDGNGTQCIACTPVQCALGERLIPCQRRADAACTACPALPSNAEFVAEGSCLTRCRAGYYADAARSGLCVRCLPPIWPCPPGQYQSSLCAESWERSAQPACVNCGAEFAAPGMEENGIEWAPTSSSVGCLQRCRSGYVWESSVPGGAATNASAKPRCVKCTPELCGTGKNGMCTGLADGYEMRLLCTACAVALPKGSVYAAPGSCLLVQCLGKDGSTQTTTGEECVRQAKIVPAAPTVTAPTTDEGGSKKGARGGYARPWLQYPQRT